MRILLIANGIVGDRASGMSGGDVRIIEIAKHWAQNGHEIHLMGSSASVELCRQRGLTVTAHVVPWQGGEGRWSFVLRAISVCVRLPRSLLRLHPDVVVSANEQLYDTLPGMMLKLWYRKRMRWGVVVHWLPQWRFWRRRGSRWLPSLAFLISERASLLLAALLADRTLAVSASTARELQRVLFPMRRVTTVDCGVDLAATRAVAAAPQTPRYAAATMMRVQAEKGVFTLIQAWRLVVEASPNAKLAIIGGGRDLPAARARIRALSLDGNIDVLGMVPDTTQAFTILRTAQIFLHPSYKENWAIVIGEAMALGLPVVGFDLPELLEVWGDAFRAVPTGDVRGLADETLALLADAQGRGDLATRGLARVRSLDWSIVAGHELAAITQGAA